MTRAFLTRPARTRRRAATQPARSSTVSNPKEVKSDCRYTKDHEWAKRDGALIVIGITAFAVDQLGDITLVGVDKKPGDALGAHETFGTIESVKTLSDLFAPVAGKVARVNSQLEDSPQLVNEDTWGAGWMIAIEPSDPGAFDALMSPEDYAAHVEASAH
jgi:glycine cleavage system H protein